MSMADVAGNVLIVHDLSAGYGGRPVVADIDLTLRRGDVMGLLGANGSGKSTLVRALTGQIRLISGSVTIGGADLGGAPQRAKAAFGLAIDAPDLPDALTGRQYLDLVAAIRGVPADAWPLGDVPARLMLTPWLGRPIGEYSLGTRAKVSIAAAILGAPSLLIFDESLNGLDPVAAWEFKRMVAELAAGGSHAIIVATHVVEAVPAFCNRVAVLADGRLVETWDAQRLAVARAAPGAIEAEVIAALRARQRQPAMAG
jgi:ABC-2 type transport system ATP-binding protein